MTQPNNCIKCIHCECEDYYLQEKGKHIGLYCRCCNKWIQWIKQPNTKDNKTNKDYMIENLSKEQPTKTQLDFLKQNNYTGIVMSKLHASNILTSIINGNKYIITKNNEFGGMIND